MSKVFKNRIDAGQQLADKLEELTLEDNALVLGLPRGGLPVAAEVGNRLNLELDVFNVRKLGVPGQPEVAMGALTEDGTRYLNHDLISALRISDADIEQVAAREQETLDRRAREYREGRQQPSFDGRQVILIDDGLATGATMRAVIESVRRQKPSRITVAVPVAARDSADSMRGITDDFVCPLEPRDFRGVGLWYQDFAQVSDDEVIGILARARRP
ncbi:phosphoribosyltransferase [Marinobacter nanhaiticus D15-8W]|uniref:Phosphoribosyltransferase n=1 Tax=Marinobacter nanhaiticus D15-8W TaxID=626887 RepID=N6W3S2_9GAMM|nr:phosphoribosyltransferase [Marinobacter nanhaiticus]ENO14774.1 phosphoribosyltransferase [Marinobacter nanhaiticus D15-8W]BES69537.1 phosphoribosyltransferase [Marinobacter nanhaiticus D15-8W]